MSAPLAQSGPAAKCEFIALRGGYHGETLGASRSPTMPVFRDAYAPLLRARIWHPLHGPAASGPSALLQQLGGRCAAVIVEPLIQGASGMRTPSAAVGVAAAVHTTRTHLIADRIAVGCGRTGRFFVWEHVQPRCPAPAASADFILLSKGITGGTLPLSVVLTTNAVFKAFPERRGGAGLLALALLHRQPIACAAACEVLRRFRDTDLLDELARQSQLLRAAFAPLATTARAAPAPSRHRAGL